MMNIKCINSNDYIHKLFKLDVYKIEQFQVENLKHKKCQFYILKGGIRYSVIRKLQGLRKRITNLYN